MTLSEKIPLMRKSATVRNIAVAILYLVTSPLWLPLFPFILFVLVWRNYGDIASSLSSVPGISEGGGVASGAVALVLCFVLFGIVGAVIPGGDVAGETRPDTGVVEGDEPTEFEEQTPAPEADPIPTPNEPPPVETDVGVISEDDFRNFLVTQGIDVTLFSRARDKESGYVLSYRSRATNSSGIAEEMGTVAGAWAVFVESNNVTGERLIVEISDADGTPAGYYEIKTEWAKEWRAGEISSDEYALRILNSLEVAEN